MLCYYLCESPAAGLRPYYTGALGAQYPLLIFAKVKVFCVNGKFLDYSFGFLIYYD